jgi:DNA replication protein DnaC
MENISYTINNMGLTASGRASGPPLTEYNCSICRDAGFVHPRMEDGKPDYSKTVPCKCSVEIFAEKRRLWLLKYCDLPFHTKDKTLENFNDFGNESLRKALGYAHEIAEGSEEIRWLTLLSMMDRGKTHLGIGVCRRYLERGIPAKFADVPTMLKDLRDSFDFEGDLSYPVKFDVYLKVPLLVLDDLGMESRTNWSREQIQTIINTRANAGLPLIVTSNLPITELMGNSNEDEHLASMRVASRLQRETWCRVVFIDTLEHRLQSRANNVE